MLRRTQTKLVLLAATTTLLTAVVFVWYQRSEVVQADLMAQERLKGKQLLVNRIVQMSGQGSQIFSYDYSLWGEMVDFVNGGPDEWGDVNVLAGLETFKASVAWVLRPDYSIRYHAERPEGDELAGLPWPAEAWPRVFAHGWFPHFFVESARGVLEVFGAPIQPSEDDPRETTPQGWFFVGLVWDQEYLAKVADLTETRVRLVAPAGGMTPPIPAESDPGVVTFSQPLTGWDGEPIRWLVAQGESQTARELALSSWREFFLLAGAFVLTLVLGVIGLQFWVTRPLGVLSRSLSEDSPAVLDRLKSNRTEFGSLAGLLTNYFQQRAELVKEIAVRKALEEHLSHMAHHDNLTGVPNRALLQDRLGQALARARRDKRPLGVLMLDLDGFKPVNDKYGHEAGDELLRSVADRLSALLRKSDTVARVGGDEFVLVLPDVGGAEDAARVARRVLEAIQRPFTVKQVEVRIGTSIGIALYPFDGADGEELMKNADTAMYRVKGRGRNDYEFFSVALSSGAQERNKLEADLREAIDKGDFAVHYQPQVELSSGRVVGAEAVVYWPHRERGLLTPDAFMPLAEETGLIVPISDWLFKTACRDAATWRKDGHRTDVLSISLSVRQFRRPDLADQLAEFLRQSGLEPEHFEIELNETVLLANPEVSLETLKRIHGIGVCVALEDFGTGHSALTHLKRFGIDTVKLARTVTQGLLTNQEHQAIVAAAVSMVHQLQGPRIIADGIRTDAERAKLLSLGCDFGQGPRFSPPVPLAEFALLLKKGSLI